VPADAAPCPELGLHILLAINGSRSSLIHAAHNDVEDPRTAWTSQEDVASKVAAQPRVCVVSTAVTANGDLHVCITDSIFRKVWHTIRFAGGRWQPWWGDVQSEVPDGPDISGRASEVACAANPNGDLHFCAIAGTKVVLSAGSIWHTIRSAGGAWQPFWGEVQSEEPEGPAIGPLSRVACACELNGDLHVCVVAKSGDLWHTIRSAGGAWQPFWGNILAATGSGGFAPPAAAVACATSPRTGDLHVCATDQAGGV
jgi:hypothetical protein